MKVTLKDQEDKLSKFLHGLKNYKKKELRALYNNALKTDYFTEEQFETLAESIEAEMRKRFPTEAKIIFGGLDSKARLFLKDLLTQVKSEFDISSNKHKNKVKCAAGVFTGDKLIDVYISYKKSTEQKCGVYVSQKTIKDPLTVTVRSIEGDVESVERFDSFNEFSELNIFSKLKVSLERFCKKANS